MPCRAISAAAIAALCTGCWQPSAQPPVTRPGSTPTSAQVEPAAPEPAEGSSRGARGPGADGSGAAAGLVQGGTGEGSPGAGSAGEGSAGEGSEFPIQSIEPQHLATRLVSALTTGDRLGVQGALIELGRNLSVWRRHPDPTLAAAVARFASWEHRGLRGRIDGRYAVPAAEFLLEQRDYAAILRLTTEYADSPAGPALLGLRELAEAESAHAPARLRVEGCEDARLDDRVVGPLATPVPSGSWTLRCPDSDTEQPLTLQPGDDVVVRWPQPGEAMIRIPARQP